jgi:hypothetical protein
MARLYKTANGTDWEYIFGDGTNGNGNGSIATGPAIEVDGSPGPEGWPYGNLFIHIDIERGDFTKKIYTRVIDFVANTNSNAVLFVNSSDAPNEDESVHVGATAEPEFILCGFPWHGSGTCVAHDKPGYGNLVLDPSTGSVWTNKLFVGHVGTSANPVYDITLAGGTIDAIDRNTALGGASPSDSHLATQRAVKLYADGKAASAEQTAHKGVANGYAGLDSDSKLTAGQTVTQIAFPPKATPLTSNMVIFEMPVAMPFTVPANGAIDRCKSQLHFGRLPTATWTGTVYRVPGTIAGCTGTPAAIGAVQVSSSGAQTWNLRQTSFSPGDCYELAAPATVDTSAANPQLAACIIQ